MSVFYCHGCVSYIDTDIDTSYEQDGETVCGGCYEPECSTCNGYGFVAGHHGLINCHDCKGRGKMISEREAMMQEMYG